LIQNIPFITHQLPLPFFVPLCFRGNPFENVKSNNFLLISAVFIFNYTCTCCGFSINRSSSKVVYD